MVQEFFKDIPLWNTTVQWLSDIHTTRGRVSRDRAIPWRWYEEHYSIKQVWLAIDRYNHPLYRSMGWQIKLGYGLP